MRKILMALVVCCSFASAYYPLAAQEAAPPKSALPEEKKTPEPKPETKKESKAKTEKTSEDKAKIDRPKYIENYDHKIILRPFLQYPISRLYIGTYDKKFDVGEINFLDPTNKTSTIYSPNVNLNIGMGVSYKGYGLSLQTAVPGTEKNQNVYGKTEYFDFQFYYISNKFGGDLLVQRYKGYYLEESILKNPFQLKDKNPTQINELIDTAEVKRPDLTVMTLGVNGYYIFSDRFSFKAAFKQTERQTRSSGSFLMMASVMHYKISSNYSLILPSKERYFDGYSGFRNGTFTSMGLLPGYSYYFTYPGDYYVVPALFIGGGKMMKRYTTDSGSRQDFDYYWKFNARLGMGYNGPKWFYGLNLIYDHTSSRNFNSSTGVAVALAVGQIEVFSGIRI